MQRAECCFPSYVHRVGCCKEHRGGQGGGEPASGRRVPSCIQQSVGHLQPADHHDASAGKQSVDGPIDQPRCVLHLEKTPQLSCVVVCVSTSCRWPRLFLVLWAWCPRPSQWASLHRGTDRRLSSGLVSMPRSLHQVENSPGYCRLHRPTPVSTVIVCRCCAGFLQAAQAGVTSAATCEF